MSQLNKRTHFVVTGHVDHGKSTFVGRLMLDMGVLPKDRFENLQNSLKTADSRIEYSHLTDALADEKSKGITIGVSQTVFNYKQNEFVFIDSPGHHQFLQNMITGASKADLAFLIVDANEGIKDSTIRHLNMLSFLQVHSIVVLINKMDLVDFSKACFTELTEQIGQTFSKLNLKILQSIPISAYMGENLVSKSKKMPWYEGPIVIDVLQSTTNQNSKNTQNENFCFIVHDIYGKTLVGEMVGARYKAGVSYVIHSSGENVQLAEDLSNFQGERYTSFILNSQNSIRRGDIILSTPQLAMIGSELQTSVIWFGSENIKRGDSIILKLAKQQVPAVISQIQNLIDSADLKDLPLNSEIKKGCVFSCRIQLESKISFADFTQLPQLGRFVLVHNGVISGAGKISSPVF